MSWQLLIGLSVSLFSISILLQRALLKENNSRPIAYSIFFQFFTGIFLTIFGLFVGKFSFPDMKPFLLNLAILTFLYGFSNVFIFKSLKQIEASKYTIVFATRALFTIAGSTFFLNESLDAKQLIGALFIFSGVILVSLKSKKFSFGKGEIFALMAAILFGLANTNDRYLLQSFDLYPYLSFAFIAPSILMGAIYSKDLKYMKLFLERRLFIKILILCIIYGLSAITFFAALQTGSNSSQIASINLSSVVITVILSIIFLKERNQIFQKILGAVVTFIGLFLIG